MNDTSIVPASTPAAPPPVRRTWLARLGDWLNAPRLLGVIAIMIALAAWLFSYRQAITLNDELAKRLAVFDTRSNESRVLASQAQETSRELLVKIGVLEQKLNESQNQQIALEALYQELARGRDEAAVAEIEQLLVSASHELQLAGNVKAALIALQTADARLARLDRPQLFPLRKAITRDIERLRAAPYVDVPGLTLKLDNLIELADTLPLTPGKPVIEQKLADKKMPAATWWQRFAREAWGDFTHLVRVQDMGKPQLPLLPPDQAYFVRENVKLRLLSARLSLLAHDDTSYKADLQAAQTWMRQYYDDKDRAVKVALAVLQQLSTSQIRVNVPDITGSLNAVHRIKLAPNR